MVVIFGCRYDRLRDIGLLKLGIVSAGHDFRLVVLPWGYPLLLFWAVRRLFDRRLHFIVSDKCFGDSIAARLFGRDCARMLWNYADEWPAAAIKRPQHKVCFFREPESNVGVFSFAPQPLPRTTGQRVSKTRQILFLGDVTTELPGLREITTWRKKFSDLCAEFGYEFYLRAEYENVIARGSTLEVERRLARVLAKNLLRLWIIQGVQKKFGGKLILVGSNWRALDMEAEASVYEESARLQLYQSAIVNLDCGSKSGDDAIYPRSSELISYSGGLLQVICSNSHSIFGERIHEFNFKTEDQLYELLESRLTEAGNCREERDDWLTRRLGEKQLLMQHSIDALLDRARRAY